MWCRVETLTELEKNVARPNKNSVQNNFFTFFVVFSISIKLTLDCVSHLTNKQKNNSNPFILGGAIVAADTKISLFQLRTNSSC